MAGPAQLEGAGAAWTGGSVRGVCSSRPAYEHCLGGRHRSPLVIVYSDDIDASVCAVVEAGGTILAGPYPFPGGRRFHFADPAGHEIAVWGPAAE